MWVTLECATSSRNGEQNVFPKMKGSWMLPNGIGSNKGPRLGGSGKECRHSPTWNEMFKSKGGTFKIPMLNSHFGN